MTTKAADDSSFADVTLTSTNKVNDQTVTNNPVSTISNEGAPAEDASGATASANESKKYGIYNYFNNLKKEFYSSNEGVLGSAVEEIKAKVIDKEIDGEDILGSWLLVEIDHWDNETEKVVVMTSESLLTVRYDFVPKRVYKFKRRSLKSIDTVKAGDFEYPGASLMHYSDELKKRTCDGVRLMWNKGIEPGFLRKWHPSSDAMPWQTFTYHPLAFSEEGKALDCYNVQHFAAAAVHAIKAAYQKHHPDRSLAVSAEPLPQNIYFGFPSQIHNQSFLGMSKDRGLVSF